MADRPQFALAHAPVWILFTTWSAGLAGARAGVLASCSGVAICVHALGSAGKHLVQTSIMSCFCCLCLQTLCSDHRKRKRVSGASCNKAREVLTSLFGQRCVDIILHDPDAVLCISCDNTLNNIAKREQKLAALKDVLERVSKAMSQGQSRKGSFPTTHSLALPPTKACCSGLTYSDSSEASSNLPVASTSVESRTTATDLSSPPPLPSHDSSDKAPMSPHQTKLLLASDGATNAPSTGQTSSMSVVKQQTSPAIEVSLHCFKIKYCFLMFVVPFLCRFWYHTKWCSFIQSEYSIKKKINQTTF